MESLHNILILIIISAIIITQFLVYRGTKNKVNSFIKVLSQTTHFKTHKVYIPIEEIDSIDSQEITDNLSYYTKNPTLTRLSEVKTTYSIKNAGKDNITSNEEEE